MAMRRTARSCLLLFAGLTSFAMMVFGARAAAGIDVHFNPVLSILYVILPVLSCPLLLLALVFRRLFVLQPILAVAFLAVYSALNWRTCASFGDCGSVAATVLLTCRTHSVLAFFAVALFSMAVLMLNKRTPPQS